MFSEPPVRVAGCDARGFFAALRLPALSVLWCVRVALTGKENTPGGASEMAELLGKERCLKRLEQAQAFLRE